MLHDCVVGVRPDWLQGLSGGYAVTFPAPIGRQTVDFPVEQLARDAVNAAWPTLQKKMRAEVPVLTEQALKSAQKPALIGLVVVAMLIVGSAWWVKNG